MLLVLCALSPCFGQQTNDSLQIKIHFKFKAEQLHPNKKYISQNNDTLHFTKIKMYLSDFHFNKAQAQTNTHLINFDDPETLTFKIAKPKNDPKTINFNVGVDSLKSLSGALAGDLDPTNGMYWAWQSGYINLKIEGTSSSCKTRKNEFQFHIGGYKQPNYALRPIEIPIKPAQKNSNSLDININLALLFDNINLQTTNSIMMPGAAAQKIADLSTQIFTIE